MKGRRHADVDLGYGVVRMKISDDGTASPEYEDCRKLAEATGRPLRTILADAQKRLLP